MPTIDASYDVLTDDADAELFTGLFGIGTSNVKFFDRQVRKSGDARASRKQYVRAELRSTEVAG